MTAVLMLLLCLLCACNSKEKDNLQAPMDFRTQLLQSQGCTFTAQITADYGDRIYEFTTNCRCGTDGSAEVTVTAPETIAGISARVTQEKGELLFDGMAVEFGQLADGNVSPVYAPLALAEAWSSEYIAAAGTEADGQRVTYESGFGNLALTVETWFDENFTPIFGEICYNDRVVVKMTITDFSFAAGGEHEATQENLG